MVVGCPGCGKQHNVGKEMAGRRAKCSCGTVIDIPQAANPVQPAAPLQPNPMPAQDPLFGQQFPAQPDPFAGQQPVAPFQQPQAAQHPNQAAQPFGSPMSGPMTTAPGQPGAMQSEPLICEFRYGKLRIWFLLCMIVAGIVSIWMIYAGIFDNKGWAINNAPLPPWGATIFFECFGGLAFGAFCLFVGGHVFQFAHPRRVAITQSLLFVPRGTFSTEELAVTLAQASYKVENQGSYSNMTIKHPGGKVRLMAMLFPSSEDFEQFAAQLSQRVAQY